MFYRNNKYVTDSEKEKGFKMKNKKTKHGVYFNHISNDWNVMSVRERTKEFLTDLKERYKFNSLHDVVCLLIANFDEERLFGKKRTHDEHIKELMLYSTNLRRSVLYEYEMLLLEISSCNFNLSPKLKQKIIDAIDGEYIEKTERRYAYYKGLVENG